MPLSSIRSSSSVDSAGNVSQSSSLSIQEAFSRVTSFFGRRIKQEVPSLTSSKKFFSRLRNFSSSKTAEVSSVENLVQCISKAKKVRDVQDILNHKMDLTISPDLENPERIRQQIQILRGAITRSQSLVDEEQKSPKRKQNFIYNKYPEVDRLLNEANNQLDVADGAYKEAGEIEEARRLLRIAQSSLDKALSTHASASALY